MNAGITHHSESWCMQLGEHAVRTAIVALVLTGQMLPAGSVSAQDSPQPPSVATPAAPVPATAEPLPMEISGAAPSADSVVAETDTLGMSIRPRIVPPRPAPGLPVPRIEAPVPQTSVSVPVTVNIHNQAMSPSWMWSVPSTYPTGWYAPTSAYLFQRPRPYWQLRGDFHHLAPFIPGLWY